VGLPLPTKSKNIEKELRKKIDSDTRVARMMEAASHAVLLVDARDIIGAANLPAKIYFGR
jgi:hypothetical protein